MSEELARKIFDYCNGTRPHLPKGFEFLDEGLTRRVYLGPDGNVYKYGSTNCNLAEASYSNWLRVNRPMPGILWPTYTVYEFGSFRSISETQFFENDFSVPDWNSRWFFKWLVRNGITDTHGGNVWQYKGHMVCIDMGFINEGDTPKEYQDELYACHVPTNLSVFDNTLY